ncbi:hypothetical protein L1887_54050 [Cichorium endivia]|nr:hypothetical protein L1887_54050 [Cichorium endivia]
MVRRRRWAGEEELLRKSCAESTNSGSKTEPPSSSSSPSPHSPHQPFFHRGPTLSGHTAVRPASRTTPRGAVDRADQKVRPIRPLEARTTSTSARSSFHRALAEPTSSLRSMHMSGKAFF